MLSALPGTFPETNAWTGQTSAFAFAMLQSSTYLTRERICQVLTNKLMLKDSQSMGLERKLSLT